MRAEGEPREFGDFAGGALGEFGMGVEAGADSGAANGEIVETIESHGDAAAVAVEQIHVARKFLAERERRGILQMGAADFYDFRKFFGFGVERVAESFDGGEQAAGGFRGRGDVHGRGKRVVGGLRHIYIVIGMNWFFAAHFAAGHFDGAIGDDFVDVHVGLRAAAGLPDVEREVIVEFSGDDFIRGLRDEGALFCGELAEILIDERGGFLEEAEGANQLRRHDILANGEVDERAGGLRAVIAVGGDVDLAHGVGLCAGRSGQGGLRGFRHRWLLNDSLCRVYQHRGSEVRRVSSNE